VRAFGAEGRGVAPLADDAGATCTHRPTPITEGCEIMTDAQLEQLTETAVVAPVGGRLVE
jgi:hypothetical protein